MDFPLIYFDPNTGLASVGIPKNPRSLKGIDKVVQIVVVAILKNTGQDVFEPGKGSGLRGMIGQFNFSEESEIKVEVTQRIEKIQREIIADQATSSVPPSERLGSISVLAIVTDALTAATAVRLRVTSEAGLSTEVTV